MATAPKRKPRPAWTGEVPRYRLTEQSFLEPHGEDSPRLVEAGQEIEFVDVPGAHMEPLNAAAEAQLEKFKPERLDINRITPLQPAKAA